MTRAILNEQNIRLEPCNLFWGLSKVFTMKTVADLTGSLNNKYFTFLAHDQEYVVKKYTVWMNVNSLGVQPVVTGTNVYVPIALATDATANTVASTIQSALDAIVEICDASVLTDTVTITLKQFGDSGLPSIGDSGFTLSVLEIGKGGSLGATVGGLELSFSKNMVMVNADQLGQQLADSILNGVSATVTGTLQETSVQMLKDLIGKSWGQLHTPAGGDEVIAVGTGGNFRNMKQFACQLLMVPVNNSDLSRAHTFWKAFPDVESLNFSGTDLQAMPVTFMTYRDSTKKANADVYVFGNYDQDFNA